MTDKPKIDDGGPLSSCSLRDHYAGLAMQGMQSNSWLMQQLDLSCKTAGQLPCEVVATLASLQADALILRKRDTEGGK